VTPAHNLAVRADDGGAQVVSDKPAFRLDGQGEKVRELRQISGTRDGELPASEKLWILRMSHAECVLAQDFGCVVARVEADTQQLRGSKSRIRSKLPLDFREVAAHARTEVGKRTARVDEGHKHSLPAVLLERNAPAVLIDQRIVRDIFSGSRHVK